MSSAQVYSMPPEPVGVSRVRAVDDSGRSFARIESGVYAGQWQGSDGGVYTWTGLLSVTDVEEIPATEFESAVAWFAGVEGGPWIPSSPSDVDWAHATAIIRHVLGVG